MSLIFLLLKILNPFMRNAEKWPKIALEHRKILKICFKYAIF